MAVSKIAVIALVAIVAAPILLGYALNLTETTETDYRETGDSVNITPLIQNGTSHTVTQANINEINTNFYLSNSPAIPYYNKVSTARTTIQMWQGTYNIAAGASQYWRFNSFPGQFYIYFGVGSAVTFNELDTGGNIQLVTVNDVIAFRYFADRGDNGNGLYLVYKSNGGSVSYEPQNRSDFMFFQNTNAYSISARVSTQDSSGTYFIDPAAGFKFNILSASLPWKINLPYYTTRFILTINLDSITDPNYTLNTGKWVFEKTTVNSVVSWNVHLSTNPSVSYDLYYNPNLTSNTYQMIVESSEDWVQHVGVDYLFKRHVEFRYVGNWPTIIGEANYYQVYEYEEDYHTTSDNPGLMEFTIFNTSTNNSTPTLRMDAANLRGFEYPVIADTTYTPADFRANPSTHIDSIQIYGDSLSFGGNTYTPANGKITIDSRSVSLDGLVFRSVKNSDTNLYDNYIGNTYISSSLNPSTITFNGKWSASISTTAQESYTYNKTEWHAGEFGWNGIDQNFLMVGLLTCLGVFTALGIYARKRGTGGIIPLMIVVGGAAMVFFVML